MEFTGLKKTFEINEFSLLSGDLMEGSPFLQCLT